MRRVVAIAIVLAPMHAGAQQPMPRRPPPLTLPAPTPQRPPAQALKEDPSDLRGRFGMDLAQRLEKENDPDERLRGIARAAAIKTPEATAFLKDALEATAPTRNDARAKIEIARGLGGRVDEAAARAGLLTLVNSANPTPTGRGVAAAARAPSDPFGDDGDQTARLELARRTAAIALAQSGDPRAIEALFALARGGGAGQAAAANALLAFPPAILALGNGPLTPPLLRVLADLGDLRALEPVRTATHANDPATRAAAITAMGQLGDARGAELARAALAESEPRMRAAGAEALVALDAPEKLIAVEALLADDATAAAGIRLAERTWNDAIVRALAARTVNASDPALRAAAVAAIGRAPSAEAVRALVALAKDALLRGDAADALARSPSDAALGAIEALAADPATRRLAVRAYVVRALVRGESSGRMRDVARELARATDPADRALGVFARTALGDVALADGLTDRAPAVRAAAALASLARDDAPSRRALLAHLATEPDALAQQALAAGLQGGDAESQITTLALVERAEAGGPDAPLAAMAFARRAGDAESAKVGALLEARDPILRAHVARGLGASALPSATGRLAEAYAYEPEATVRRAIVTALAARGDASPARRATLAIATRLDPDGGTRWIAQRALSMRTEDARDALGSAARDGASREVAWVRLVTPDGSAPPPQAAAFVRADGLAVPIVFDADGYALVPGLPPGESRLVLAPKLPAAYSRPSP